MFALLEWRWKHEWFIGFENVCYIWKTCVIIRSLNTVHFYVSYCWWRHFLWQLIMCIVKYKKPCINSTWIAWLFHGVFVGKKMAVNIVLLISCDVAFYAIIHFENHIWYVPRIGEHRRLSWCCVTRPNSYMLHTQRRDVGVMVNYFVFTVWLAPLSLLL